MRLRSGQAKGRARVSCSDIPTVNALQRALKINSFMGKNHLARAKKPLDFKQSNRRRRSSVFKFVRTQRITPARGMFPVLFFHLSAVNYIYYLSDAEQKTREKLRFCFQKKDVSLRPSAAPLRLSHVFLLYNPPLALNEKLKLT